MLILSFVDGEHKNIKKEAEVSKLWKVKMLIIYKLISCSAKRSELAEVKYFSMLGIIILHQLLLSLNENILRLRVDLL